MEYALAFPIIIPRFVNLDLLSKLYHKNKFPPHKSHSDIHILITLISMQTFTANRVLSVALVLLFAYLCGVSLQTNQACHSQYEMCNAHRQRLTLQTYIW
jgi:hypothetical protein